MSFDEYGKQAWDTAIYPDKGNNLVYPALGLCGETGEVVEKIKKKIRDGIFIRAEIVKELGDVLWYLNALAYELGYTLEEVAYINLNKLQSRKDRDQLQGSGDNR